MKLKLVLHRTRFDAEAIKELACFVELEVGDAIITLMLRVTRVRSCAMAVAALRRSKSPIIYNNGKIIFLERDGYIFRNKDDYSIVSPAC